MLLLTDFGATSTRARQQVAEGLGGTEPAHGRLADDPVPRADPGRRQQRPDRPAPRHRRRGPGAGVDPHHPRGCLDASGRRDRPPGPTTPDPACS
nr:hypothetical protein [Angustibacter aerolatus]